MIKIEHLNKKFGDKVVFEDFSLTINDGEFIVLAGKSGCGKTTLLNMLGGIEPFDSGDIKINDNSVRCKRFLKEYYLYEVGFLFQNFALIENKTVRSNIEMVQKKSRSKYTVEEALDKVNMSDEIDTKVYKLSGGEQQRVALARLIFKKCNIILADEPTGSLDRENAQNVMDILKDLNREGKTIVFVTHDENIIKNSDRVVML